jgi:membrane protein implicated in regulation of membrane protease activity
MEIGGVMARRRQNTAVWTMVAADGFRQRRYVERQTNVEGCGHVRSDGQMWRAAAA